MALAIHKILFQHFGENAGTEKDPIAVGSCQVDLSTQARVCWSFDDNRIVEVNLYQVRDIVLPDWLRPEEWITHHVDFRYAWARGMKADTPEGRARRLMKLGPTKQYMCFKLLATKKFRSEFRKSLCEQLVMWLDGNSEHDQPFSGKQWELLITQYDANDCKRIDDVVYRNKRTTEGVVPATEVADAIA